MLQSLTPCCLTGHTVQHYLSFVCGPCWAVNRFTSNCRRHRSDVERVLGVVSSCKSVLGTNIPCLSCLWVLVFVLPVKPECAWVRRILSLPGNEQLSMFNGLSDTIIPEEKALIAKCCQLLLELLDLLVIARFVSWVSLFEALVEVRIVPHGWVKRVGCQTGSERNADASGNERDRPKPAFWKFCHQVRGDLITTLAFGYRVICVMLVMVVMVASVINLPVLSLWEPMLVIWVFTARCHCDSNSFLLAALSTCRSKPQHKKGEDTVVVYQCHTV